MKSELYIVRNNPPPLLSLLTVPEKEREKQRSCVLFSSKLWVCEFQLFNFPSYAPFWLLLCEKFASLYFLDWIVAWGGGESRVRNLGLWIDWGGKEFRLSLILFDSVGWIWDHSLPLGCNWERYDVLKLVSDHECAVLLRILFGIACLGLFIGELVVVIFLAVNAKWIFQIDFFFFLFFSVAA